VDKVCLDGKRYRWVEQRLIMLPLTIGVPKACVNVSRKVGTEREKTLGEHTHRDACNL